MKSGLKMALQSSYGNHVNSGDLDAASDNLLSFFALLMEADRRAGYPILNDTLYGRLSPDDVEYMFT